MIQMEKGLVGHIEDANKGTDSQKVAPMRTRRNTRTTKQGVADVVSGNFSFLAIKYVTNNFRHYSKSQDGSLILSYTGEQDATNSENRSWCFPSKLATCLLKICVRSQKSKYYWIKL